MSECIVNVTFGEPYDEFQPRLLASLDRFWTGSRMIWTGVLPKGSPPHSACPFGFKLHAIREAREAGHEVVIWLDGGGYLTQPLDGLLEKVRRVGYYAVAGNHPVYGQLHRWISDDALRGLGESRENLKEKRVRLLGGTPYAFDFGNAVTREFFGRWWKAMEGGLFAHVPGAGNEDFLGHRHDEAVASVLFHQLGMVPSEMGEFYNGDELETPSSVAIKSGAVRT